MTATDFATQLKIVLAERGLEAAIALLNSFTGCRFTSMFRFDGRMLRPLTFYDRADPAAEPPEDIPVEASYCVFVRDTGLPFRVDDSSADVRVEHHPKRREILAYCGVPLKDEYGITFGTLCHFDVRAVPITDADVRRMEDFARIVNEVATLRKPS